MPVSDQRKRILAAALLALLLVGGLFWGKLRPADADAPDANQAGGPPPGLPVETALVITGPADRETTAIGSLRADEGVTITSEIAGRVAEIHFNEGDSVAADQPLFRLDQEMGLAERDRAAAALALSETNLRRAEMLFQDQAIAERERDEALAQWRLDQADLRLAEARLAKTAIRAPFAGLLGLRQVSVGSYLQPGEAVVTLDAIDPLKVDFQLPETKSAALRVGQPLTIRVEALPGRTFAGRVEAISPRLDEAGRSIRLRAVIANPEQLLKPGMFAQVRLILEQRPEALLVPEAAILPSAEGQSVFRVKEGVVEAVAVTTGLRRQGLVEITGGLAAGDQVITGGQIKVRPGMPVTPLPPPGSAPEPGATP